MKLTDLTEAVKTLEPEQLKDLIMQAAAQQLHDEMEDENLEDYFQHNSTQAAYKIHKQLDTAARDIIASIIDLMNTDHRLDKAYKKAYPKDYNIMTGKHGG